MFVDVLNAQRRQHRDLSSLSTGIMAGAPCPPELVMSVINELNMKDFLVRTNIKVVIYLLQKHSFIFNFLQSSSSLRVEKRLDVITAMKELSLTHTRLEKR